MLTVGSWDDNVTETGNSGRLTKITTDSGRRNLCIVKPEVLAPGTNVKSCSKDAKGYIVKSGTSMAAPVVWSDRTCISEIPGLYADRDET